MQKPMDQKTSEMIKAIDALFPGTKEAIDYDKCSLCHSDIDKRKDEHHGGFRNELSIREYYISGMCQKCQDTVFGKD